MADLRLGNAPDKLTVDLVSNDPVTFSLTLMVAGVATPWPSAPVLEFTGISWTATLDVTGSVATWDQTESEVNAVLALPKKTVRLSVDGVTWWAGVAVKRA